MSGLISVVYARQKLDDRALDSIDEILAAVSIPLQRTRKGRVWDCTIGDRSIHVAVEQTENVLWDCEDELPELGLLPDDAPFRVVITAPTGAADAAKIIGSLADKIAQVVNGVVVGPVR